MLFKLSWLFLPLIFSPVTTAKYFTVPDIHINAFGVKIGEPYKDYSYLSYPFKTKVNITPEHPLPEVFNHYQIILNRDSTVHSVYAYGDTYKGWGDCDVDARKLFLSLQKEYTGFVKGSMDTNRYYLLAGNTQDLIIKCNKKNKLYFIAKMKEDMIPDPKEKPVDNH